MNKKNSPIEGDFLKLLNFNSICSHYLEFNIENMLEWDENKNKINQNKHKISFQRVTDLLQDKSMIQIAEKPEKWEDLSNLHPSIERNEGNTDPVRGKLVGIIDNKLYTAIYTFRGGAGEMRYRIISLRRADENEIGAYGHLKKI